MFSVFSFQPLADFPGLGRRADQPVKTDASALNFGLREQSLLLMRNFGTFKHLVMLAVQDTCVNSLTVFFVVDPQQP